MTRSERARIRARRIRIRRIRLAGLLVGIAVVAAALAFQSLASSPSTASSPSLSTTASPRSIADEELPDAPPEPGAALGGQRRSLGTADGALPSGTSVFDDRIPGVGKLDAALLSALRQAATDAADGGVRFVVDSGWRSPAYQGRLLQEAVSKYGSEAEAARWVATAETSAHVSGDAVDIGPSEAARWLSRNGAWYGLCQIYDNEPWHYELRPEAVDSGCPRRYADPTHDPRMRQ